MMTFKELINSLTEAVEAIDQAVLGPGRER
jgi:hypothetical protein